MGGAGEMADCSKNGTRLDERTALLVAGLADLAVCTVSSLAATAQGLLRRSDGPEIARDAEQDLMARGRLVLDRFSAAPAHLEILAQHSLARRAASSGDV